MASRDGLRLASFDGGGATSFSQLEIMRAIMHQLVWDKYPNEPDKVMLPCEYFDLIGGSDTGGLIAILFSKLRMSVEEASDEFFMICEKVYTDQGFTSSERTQQLRACIEDILRRKDLPHDLKLVEKVEEGRSACFVLAALRANTGDKTCIRSYPIRSQPALAITVVDAILATCATQPSFLPVISGTGYRKKEYIGAGHGANNPIREVITEAHSLFGGESTVASLLSLGSGNPGAISLPSGSEKLDLHRVVLGMMQDGEQRAKETQQQIGRVGIYFRFSVDQGMQSLHQGQLQDVEWIVAQAESYLGDATINEKLDLCAKTMEARVKTISLDRLKHTDGPVAIYKGTPMLATHYIKRQGPRDAILEGIESENQGQRIIVVTGMPGCGKTQLITELSRQFSPERSPHFDYVFFVDGSSDASIKADLILHVKHAMSTGSDLDLQGAMSFFQNPKNSKWLIAFDNVDDVNIDLPKYIPQCNCGTVLITSRNQSLGLLASEAHLHLKLDVMSENEATELITKCAKKENFSVQESKAISKTAETLGYLPIALSQAGCYMAEAGCSVTEYLELLSESRLQLLDRPSRTRQKDCAYATFDISYKRLPTYIQNFVHILSFYHFADVPMNMVLHAAKSSFRLDPFPFIERGLEFERSIQILNETFLANGEWTNLSLQEFVLILQSYSLASFTTSYSVKLLRIHPLVRDWAFDRLGLDRRVDFQRAALRLLVASINDEPFVGYLPRHGTAFWSRSKHDQICVNDRAALGSLLKRQYQPEAREIWLPIYDAIHQEHGNDHLHVATAALELAGTYKDSNLQQTAELQNDAIRIRTLLLGLYHLDTFEASLALSITLYDQDKRSEACELVEEVLKHMREHFDPTHVSVLQAEEILAWMHIRQNKLQEAEAAQQRFLEGQKARSGDTHKHTLQAMLMLAWTYQKDGRYSEAEDLLLKVVEARKTQLGEADSDTLIAMSMLGVTYCDHGRYSEAELVQTKVLEHRIARSGEDDGDTCIARNRLALTYRRQRRYDEAEALQIKGLDIKREQLGDTNYDILFAMEDLGLTYCDHGKFAEAEAIQLRVLEERQTRLGDTAHYTLTAMFNLALTYYAQRKLPEAEALQVKIVEGRKLQGEEDPDTLTAMGKLALTLYDLGRYSEAETLQIKVVKGRKAQLQSEHPDLLVAVQELVRTCRAQGRDGFASDEL